MKIRVDDNREVKELNNVHKIEIVLPNGDEFDIRVVDSDALSISVERSMYIVPRAINAVKIRVGESVVEILQHQKDLVHAVVSPYEENEQLRTALQEVLFFSGFSSRK